MYRNKLVRRRQESRI